MLFTILFKCLLSCKINHLHCCVLSGQDKEAINTKRNSCPEFWYSFNGRCYKYIATKMTWADAELYCRSVDSNLVSIHSLEEHNFVNAMIKSYDPTQAFTWIGLSDLHKEGSWMWSDGSKMDFLLWDEGQPDNAGENENCGHTNMYTHYKWNDYVCSLTFSFVCKKHCAC
uniref:C-type lectin domain-containing protein n=1 Tax=Poecilia formosa TaxID=48698 RepID=A0A087XAN7_POEFO